MLLASNTADCDRSWMHDLRTARALAAAASVGTAEQACESPTICYAPTRARKTCRVAENLPRGLVAAPSGGVGAARKGKNKGNKKQRGGGSKTGGERGWLMDD